MFLILQIFYFTIISKFFNFRGGVYAVILDHGQSLLSRTTFEY